MAGSDGGRRDEPGGLGMRHCEKCDRIVMGEHHYCCVKEDGVSKVEVGASKATSSHEALPFWQVPLSIEESIARRIKKSQHETFNWRRGLGDVEFIRDRAGHALEHLKALTMGKFDEEDKTHQDHIDALSWFCMFINEAMRLHPGKVIEAFYSEWRGGDI